MFTVGLTGGIGAGKSTVASSFAKLGAGTVDADKIARQLVEPGQEALAKIVEHFGEEMLNPDGTLNRAKLREWVFHDETERMWLEGLLHPLIRRHITQQVASLTGPYAILILPLLVETEWHDLANRILVVDASEALQIERTMARDGLSEADVLSIMDVQASREQRMSIAEDIIDNDHDLEALQAQVSELHQNYLKLAGQA